MRLVENTAERLEYRHQPWVAAGLTAAWTLAFLAGGIYSLITGDFLNLVPMAGGVLLGLLAWRLLARPTRLMADARTGQIAQTRGRRHQHWPLSDIAEARCAETLVRSAGYRSVHTAVLEFKDGRRAEPIWTGYGPQTACQVAKTLEAWLGARR